MKHLLTACLFFSFFLETSASARVWHSGTTGGTHRYVPHRAQGCVRYDVQWLTFSGGNQVSYSPERDEFDVSLVFGVLPSDLVVYYTKAVGSSYEKRTQDEREILNEDFPVLDNTFPDWDAIIQKRGVRINTDSFTPYDLVANHYTVTFSAPREVFGEGSMLLIRTVKPSTIAVRDMYGTEESTYGCKDLHKVFFRESHLDLLWNRRKI